LYEVASKRVNIVDCEVDVIKGGPLLQGSKVYRELAKINQGTIIKHLSKWEFSDPRATRKELLEHLCTYLRSKGLEVERSCIPSIIIEKKFPIEVLSYTEERDFYELLGRMLWIHEQYDSVIGILSGVMNPEVAEEIANSYHDVFLDEEEVALMLA
jgi:hypothetical protein